MLNKPNQPVKALPEAIFYDKRFSDTQPEAFNIYQQQLNMKAGVTEKNFNNDFIRTSEFFALNNQNTLSNTIQPHVTLRKKDFEDFMRSSQTSFRRTQSGFQTQQ